MTKSRAATKPRSDAPTGLAEDIADIVAGLTAPQKSISPKYFYDERGSRLFDRICELPEYYLTRTEREIMEQCLGEIAALVGPRASVIEFGSGSSKKIRQLLDRLIEPVAYVAVDISAAYLSAMTAALSRDYPNLQIAPVVADFTRPFELPSHRVEPLRNLIFFPGSTIGNFAPREAHSLLDVMRTEAKPGGALLIGVDLKKDPRIIEAAYNDSAGVTAEFNLNVLRRINEELGANFDLASFRHEAVYQPEAGRVEIRLVCRRPQRVRIAGLSIEFRAREHIVTEHSHKFTEDEFAALATSAGFEPVQTWTDSAGLFSVNYLVVPP